MFETTVKKGQPHWFGYVKHMEGFRRADTQLGSCWETSLLATHYLLFTHYLERHHLERH